MAALDEFVQVGFKPITKWILKRNTIGPASFQWKDHSGWLYVFAVDGDARYVGLTTRVLRSRLSDYAHTMEFHTTRLREAIIAELNAGRSVEIYGRRENRKHVLRAEEARLRAVYRLPWNWV